MPDLNSDALGIWEHLKPAIDKEIEQKTRGMVQRRKMKVTTAPSISTGTIGVTEAFGTTEMVIPFATNLISATVGDMVWVEFMYGATNAFASMFASADEKDWDVAGDLTVHGVLDVTKRRCHATLSSAGWYRVLKCQPPIAYYYSGIIIKFYISVYGSQSSAHEISLAVTRNDGARFYGEHSANFQEYVEAIRATSDGTNLFVDIKWNRAVERDVTIYFDAFPDIDWQPYITAQSLQGVAPSPDGETVLGAEYTFAENTYNGMRYYRETVSSITIGSNGFATMTMPSQIVGRKIVNIMLVTFSTISGGAMSILSYSNASGNARSNYYMAGSVGASITNVIIEYWYL